MRKVKSFLLAMLVISIYSCDLNNEDIVIKEKQEDLNTGSLSDKNGSQARIMADVTNANLSLGIISPVDANGNVIVNASGVTTVNYRVLVTRVSSTQDVHLQWQILTSSLTPLKTGPIIRTLDFPANENSITSTGSFEVAANQVGNGNSDICLTVRNFLIPGPNNDVFLTRECKNVVISNTVPGVGQINEQNDWVFDGTRCAWMDEYNQSRLLPVNINGGLSIPGATYLWYGGESNVRWKRTVPSPYDASSWFVTKSGASFPFTFTVYVRVSKPGYDDVIRSREITIRDCVYIED